LVHLATDRMEVNFFSGHNLFSFACLR